MTYYYQVGQNVEWDTDSIHDFIRDNSKQYAKKYGAVVTIERIEQWDEYQLLYFITNAPNNVSFVEEWFRPTKKAKPFRLGEISD